MIYLVSNSPSSGDLSSHIIKLFTHVSKKAAQVPMGKVKKFNFFLNAANKRDINTKLA
jgi:hypothetical protein